MAALEASMATIAENILPTALVLIETTVARPGLGYGLHFCLS